MNKRIQELINLSTERVELNIRGDDTIDTEMVFNKEKFAELIVKECIDAVSAAGGDDTYYHIGAIKLRFEDKSRIQLFWN